MSYDLLAIWIGWKTKDTGPGVSFPCSFPFLKHLPWCLRYPLFLNILLLLPVFFGT